jgi:hypothetical protein
MPDHCEERQISLEWAGPLTRCVMDAPPYIAEWIESHPNWTAQRWRCDYPENEDKKA